MLLGLATGTPRFLVLIARRERPSRVDWRCWAAGDAAVVFCKVVMLVDSDVGPKDKIGREEEK